MSEELSKSKVIEVLNWAYDVVNKKSADTLVTSSSGTLAREYLAEAKGNVEEAIDITINRHTTKTAINGAVAGLFGGATILVSLPAEISSLILNQLRMIQTIALLRGYDVADENVKKLCILCLAGSKLSDILFKNFAIKQGVVITTKIVQYFATETITEVMARWLVLNFTSKSSRILTKIIPGVSSVCGALFDGVMIYSVGKTAKMAFPQNREALYYLNNNLLTN